LAANAQRAFAVLAAALYRLREIKRSAELDSAKMPAYRGFVNYLVARFMLRLMETGGRPS
jgi:hypothetical protein